MKRRWLIRSVFILPILLCVGGWVWSGFYGRAVGYYRAGHGVWCATEWGVVSVGVGPDRGMPDGWRYLVDPLPHFLFWPTNEPESFLGFRLPPHGFSPGWYGVAVPYWFLIILFALVLVFVWRKTGKKKPDHGFPVEMTTSTTKTAASKTGTIST